MESTAADFDFLFGHWDVQHRRLQRRLQGCSDWDAFNGTCFAQPILGGCGNIDDNLLKLPQETYRAASLRTFDPITRQWSIWWIDGRSPGRLEVPMVGGFEGRVGVFYAEDTLDGKVIRVRFRWTDVDSDSPRWEQAFSDDNGVGWETNWTMAFRRKVPTDGCW